jgi:hypothetical protein
MAVFGGLAKVNREHHVSEVQGGLAYYRRTKLTDLMIHGSVRENYIEENHWATRHSFDSIHASKCSAKSNFWLL